jgi:membrane associated rhomboid family serine protease
MTPGIKYLIIANVLVFFAVVISRGTWTYMFGLIPHYVVKSFAVWQLVTYLFIHANFGHIFFNMFILWMFGSEMEQLWGTREFLKYYFFCGIGAGLVTLVCNWNSVIPTVGASGAVFGVLLAFGLRFPDRPILLFFILPMKAIHLVLVSVILEVYYLWTQPNDGIGHMAHLGGLVFGFIYLKKARSINRLFDEVRWRRARKKFHIMTSDEEEKERRWPPRDDDDDEVIH